MKKGFKIGIWLMIGLFFVLFFSYKNGYYIDKNKEKSFLTEEMIKEYEEDLKNGVDVTQKEYVVLTESYDNNYTRISLRIANRIEKAFDKIIKFFFNRIGKTINN